MILGKKQYKGNIFFIIFAPKLLSMTLQKWIEDRAIHGFPTFSVEDVRAAVFSDEFLASQLAFREGTALHKLYLSPQSRYSEDIDLVQITPGPIKPIMYRLGEVLDWLPDRVTYGVRR